MRVLKRRLALAVTPFVRFAFRLWVRYAEAVIVDGIPIVSTFGSSETREALERMSDALQLIRRTDPRAHTRVRRHLRRIVLAHTGGAGEYWYGMGTAVVDVGYLRSHDAIFAAMVLVHEATHGRLDAMRIGITNDNRARVERLCSEAEIAFAERLQGTAAHIQTVRESLARGWWSEAAHRERTSRRRSAARRSPPT